MPKGSKRMLKGDLPEDAANLPSYGIAASAVMAIAICTIIALHMFAG